MSIRVFAEIHANDSVEEIQEANVSAMKTLVHTMDKWLLQVNAKKNLQSAKK